MNGQVRPGPAFPGPGKLPARFPTPRRAFPRPYTTGRTDSAPANGLPPSGAGAVHEVRGHLVSAAVAALRQGGGPQPTTEKGVPG